MGQEMDYSETQEDEPEIFVCHAGTCRALGAEAVLAEIEELANAVGEKCSVRRSGCLVL